MKESTFIQRNKNRWEEFESVVNGRNTIASPDHIAKLFVQLTDDLAYARTQYPNSRTTQYLNALAVQVHRKIYKVKREDKNRFIDFWKWEVPFAVYQARKHMLSSAIIFMAAVLIGVVSSQYDDAFVRLILGDTYVNMTIQNIKDGKPTGVYANSGMMTMFFQITLNNILVSFRAFVMGVFASVGTGLMLFYNGVMVGAFVTMFAIEGLFEHAFPVIMLHGTIELTSIVIAGGAGFIMGNSLLFPGTYSRIDSFKMGAVQGLKIVIGLVPFFIIAGFIESFITRYEYMHWSFKSLVIGASTLLMIYYFILYPYALKRNGKF
jgi:uncharacterized membrane protein SpoIIM required for sporulation